MKVKRYIANNAQEAMLKVKTELGVNAIILHSRKIKRSGIMGFFKKPLIEMVAAIEENDEKNEQKHNSQNQMKNNMQRERNNTNRQSEIRNNMQSERNNTNKQGKTDKIDELQYQVGNIENILSNFIHKIDNIDEKKETKRPELFEKYYNQLLENNIEKNIVDKIMNIAIKQMSFSNENEEAINKAIKIIIRQYLGSSEFMIENDNGQRRIVFVGATGVGKTTTIAKLAARLSIGEKKSVALITADTYRIAAVEQLRTYSEILDIPIKVIYEPEEIKDAIEGYKDKDIILVDTAGRNHRSSEQLDEIKKLINYIENPDIFLVISATTGYKDIKSIIDSYQFIEDYNLLFTKLDEANGFGNILNTKILTGKNLSYVTTGQSVPDDIEIVNPEKIANIIVGKHHE